MPIPLGPAIVAGAGLIDTASSALSQQSVNKKTRKWNEKMYKWQRADALADWAMSNEYNSPAAHMQRLKDAGLNPALFYEGGQTGGEAAPVRQSSVESWNPKAPEFNLGNSMMSFYDAEFKTAQTDNVKAQTAVATQEAILKAVQTVAATTSNETAKFDLELKKELRGFSVEAAKAAVEKVKADTQFTLDANERAKAMQAPTLVKAAEEILNLRKSRAVSDAQIREIDEKIKNIRADTKLKDYEGRLNDSGVNKSDAIWWRKLAEVVGMDGKTGGKIGEFMQHDKTYDNAWKGTQPGEAAKYLRKRKK